MEKYPMTLPGYEKLQAELRTLKTEERPAVIAAIAVVTASIAPLKAYKSRVRHRRGDRRTGWEFATN